MVASAKSTIFPILIIISEIISLSKSQFNCNDAYECVGVHHVISNPNASGYIRSYGYKSLSGPTTSINMLYDYLSDGDLYCDGSFSCYDILFINSTSKVWCDGGSSCKDINGLSYIKTNGAHNNIRCDASNACLYSQLIGNPNDNRNEVICLGDRSCGYSTVAGIHYLNSYGAYSFIYGTFNSSGLRYDPYLAFWGYYAGFGAHVICSPTETCTIYCFGTGCFMLYLECQGINNCIVIKLNTNETIATIDPIFNLTEFNSSLLNDFGYNSELLALQNEEQCNQSLLTNRTFDDYKQRFGDDIVVNVSNPGPICCRGGSSCPSTIEFAMDTDIMDSVVCDASYSCQGTDIINHNGPVYCTGRSSCRYADISTTDNVYCLGSDGCITSAIRNAKNVFCSGINGCNHAHIYSDGDINVYLLANGLNDVTIHCKNKNDTCYVFCEPIDMNCMESNIICNGICIVDCFSPNCPQIYTPNPTLNPSVNPTRTPTMNTSNPTYNPSSHPTKYPSVNPSESPTAQTSMPSVSPTRNPTKLPTDDPSAIPTMLPTTYPSANPTTSTTEEVNGDGCYSNNNICVSLIIGMIMIGVLSII